MSNSPVVEGYVTSRDGTRIGFLRRGSGPGLVLVQGAMATAYNYDELSEALSSDFTVYAVDRRGRGLSPRPYDRRHDIARDVEDVDAVLAEAGAGHVFGLSSGAMITLEAARTLPRITRAAVYEPPFYADGISRSRIRRFNAEIERGDTAAALVSALRISAAAPAPLRALLATPLSGLLARGVIRRDDRSSGPYATFRDLLPGARYDFHDVEGMDGRMGTLAAIDIPMLLLSGTRSPAYLRHSIRSLNDTIARSRFVELDGLGHSGSWNAGRGGRPLIVAAALREFFA